MWCQNKNFWDPHGFLGGKYKTFGKLISFLAWKKTRNFFVEDLKKEMENPFQDFLNID